MGFYLKRVVLDSTFIVSEVESFGILFFHQGIRALMYIVYWHRMKTILLFLRLVCL
jgi:hypothetical protein